MPTRNRSPRPEQSMTHTDLMNRSAATDATFVQRETLWVGHCLICSGPVCFDALTGEGATIEHILPRSLGGTNELNNLSIAHRRCNSEKGRHWDPRRRHRAYPDRYDALLQRLLGGVAASLAGGRRRRRASNMNDEPQPYSATESPDGPLPNRLTRGTLAGCLGLAGVFALPLMLFLPLESWDLPLGFLLVQLAAFCAFGGGIWLLTHMPSATQQRTNDPMHPLHGARSGSCA